MLSPLALPTSLELYYFLIHVYSYIPPTKHISHGQNGGNILYHWNTLPQSTHLHIEECRSEKCHEKIMACQDSLRRIRCIVDMA